MIRTIGDYWRSCSNEELATNMVDFLMSLLSSAGISEDSIDMVREFEVMLEFFNTEYDDEYTMSDHPNNFSGGFSYIN